jgi:hypothetical protein
VYEGFLTELVPPSPNCQDHEVIVPEEESENVTASGKAPAFGVALKSATGAAALTLIDCEAVVLPPLPVTVSETGYVPGVEYVLATVGVVAVVPSPRLQDRLVTLPVEVSVSVTASGAVPVLGVAVKLAWGTVDP